MAIESVQLDVSEFIDFSERLDYTGFDWKTLLSNMADLIPSVCPEWTDYSSSDMGMCLLQIVSGGMDVISYRTDFAMNERFLQTCVLKKSAVQLAKLIDYTPAPGVSATVMVAFLVSSVPTTVPAGTKVSTVGTPATSAVVFETVEDLTIVGPIPIGGVEAIEGETESGEVIGSSDGTAYQLFSLLKYPVAYNSIGTSSLAITVTEGGVPTVWTEIENLLDGSMIDRIYEPEVDETGKVSILFGDDRNGKIPASGTDNIAGNYRVGGGERGNVAGGTIIVMVSSVANVVLVVNGSDASGGADVESVEDIRRNAPRMLRTAWRAVTAEDYRTLAEARPGVSKAFAECDIPGAVPYNKVNLYIAPEGGGIPSTELKDALTEYFEEREMLCVTTTVLDPTYIDVAVTIDVIALSNYLNSDVETRVTQAINDYFDLENTGFGYDIWLSDFLAALEGIAGVDHSDLTELYDEAGAPGLANVELDVTEIPALGTLIITVTGGAT